MAAFHGRAYPLNKSLTKTKGTNKQRQWAVRRALWDRPGQRPAAADDDVDINAWSTSGQEFRQTRLKYVTLAPCKNNPECCICCDTHAGVCEDPYAMLECGHVYGRACLDRSLEANSSCPLCRRAVD
jgi:hypothetical protein